MDSMKKDRFNIDTPATIPDWIDSDAKRAEFPEDGIRFTSDFSCGNGQDFRRLDSYHYSFRSRVAKQNFSYRFFMKIDSDENVERITLRVLDFKMSDPPSKDKETAAMISYNEDDWNVIHSEDITLLPDSGKSDEDYVSSSGPYAVEYVIRPERFPVWIASPMPYRIEEFKNLLNDCVMADCTGVQIIGKTHCGLDIPMITVGDPSNAEDGREKIFVTGGQHPSEVSGILAVEGMIRDMLESIELRRQIILYAVPIVSMDGFYFGRTVSNCANETGCNLNRDWTDVSQPETISVLGKIEEIRPDIFIDSHNGRGWNEYRLQDFIEQPDVVTLTKKIKTFMDGNNMITLVRGGGRYEEVSTSNRRVLDACGVSFIFENVLTLNPSKENYIKGGRMLLEAIVQ